MAKGKKTEDIIKRTEILQQLITEFKSDGKNPARKEIVIAMKESGYKHYNNVMYYRDQTLLNRTNSFVRDITESNFSAMVQKEYDVLDEISEKLNEWEQKPPMISHMNFESVANPGFDSSKAVSDTNQKYFNKLVGMTQEIVSPITITDMRAKIALTKLRLLNGDVVDASMALLTSRFQELNDELEKTKIERDKLKEEKKALASHN